MLKNGRGHFIQKTMNVECLSDFVCRGKIGQISLWMTRQQAYQRLGEPKDWLGKQTVIGATIESYRYSELWFYYDGSVGVRFGEDGIAEKVLIYPRKVNDCNDLFKSWPTMRNLTMGQWRATLQANNIFFRESDPRSLNYWIVAGENCVTCCFPSSDETEAKSNGHDRVIEMLQKYSSTEAMEIGSAFINGP